MKKTVSKNKTTIVEGDWGGAGIGLVISDNAVQIEYDCAESEVPQKFTIDADGNFSLNGFYKRQTPVIRVDIVPQPQPASFEGKISGSTMRLKVVLTATKEVVGEYVLTRGQTPGIRKCR